GGAVAISARSVGLAASRRNEAAAECPQDPAGDSHGDSQCDGHVPRTAAAPNLLATLATSTWRHPASSRQQSAPGMAGARTSSASRTPENPQDGNYPQRVAGEDFTDSINANLSVALLPPPKRSATG